MAPAAAASPSGVAVVHRRGPPNWAGRLWFFQSALFSLCAMNTHPGWHEKLLAPSLVLAAACLAPSLAAGQPPAPSELSATPPRSLAEELPRSQPLSPEEAADSFITCDGFRLELLAAEPLTADPVAMVYDENGVAFVAEMADYPYSDKSHDKPWQDQTSAPLGRVRRLEDVDGDGRFDKSQVFAEGLSWPTGLAVWKGGLFVCCTPELLYLKDADGDGVADERRVVYSGFRKYNVQAVINNLQWGLDHRIYAAGSSNGGQISRGDVGAAADAPPAGEIEFRLGQNDFCFEPRSFEVELLAGGARFGNAFDDFGRRFICNIRNPVQHVVLDNRYLAKSVHLPVKTALHDAADAGEVQVFRASPPEPWRVISAQRAAANPDSPLPKSEKAAVGYVTSSSGVAIYRGGAYPPEFEGNAFVGEVAGNVVLRYRLFPQGPTFRAERVAADREFIASTDNWFRPVNFINAPDGTLHLLDMYRETIEHPWSIPEDIKAHLDLRSGADRGRIWRLVPERWRDGYQPPPPPRLGHATSQELVRELESPHSWRRETAHRLIFERQDLSAVPSLRRLLASGTSPQARLHALWSLEGLEQLSSDDLLLALKDAAGPVREHAIRLAEARPNRRRLLMERLSTLAEDDDVRVRLQAALTLGWLSATESLAASDHRSIAKALAEISRRDASDPWMRTAVVASLGDSVAPFLLDALGDASLLGTAAGRELMRLVASVVGARRQADEAPQVLAALAAREQSGQSSDDILLALAEGLKRSNQHLGGLAGDGDSAIGRYVKQRLTAAAADAGRAELALDTRLAALKLACMGDFDSCRELLLRLLDPSAPPSLQLAAVEQLSGFADPRVGPLLVSHYDRMTPTLRRSAVTALLARADRHAALVEAIAGGRVSPSLLSAAQRQLLLNSGQPEVRAAAGKVLAEDAFGPRKTVIDRYQSALSLKADPARGLAIYRRDCGNCHRLAGQGHAVGPDLATVRHRTASEVLTHILDPNKEVSPHFLEYVVATSDGRIFTGVVAAETASGITLRAAENREQVIARAEIDSMISSGKSLMPEGLEEKISPQEMADLLSLLVSGAGH